LQAQEYNLTQQQNLLQNITAIKKQLNDEEQYLGKIQQQIDETQKGLDKISQAQSVLSFKDDIAILQSKDNSIGQAKEELVALKHELKFIRDQVANIEIEPNLLGKQSFTRTTENFRKRQITTKPIHF